MKNYNEYINESFKDVMNYNYFIDSDIFVVEFYKNINDGKFKRIKNILDKVFGILISDYILPYIQNNMTEDKFCILICLNPKETRFTWYYCKISQLPTFIRNGNHKYKKAYTEKEIDSLLKLESILKYGGQPPSYAPKRRMLESANENILGMPPIPPILTPEKQREIYKIGEYVIPRPDAFDYFKDTGQEMEDYFGKKFRITDISTLRDTYRNGYDEQIDNTENVNPEDLLVTLERIRGGSTWYWYYRCLFSPKTAIPNYKPRKFRNFESVNESFEDTKKSNYFSNYDVLVIIFDQNIPKQEFDNFRKIINEMFSNQNNYNGLLLNDPLYRNVHDQCHEDKFYIDISYSEERGRFEMGFCYLSYLDKHMSQHNLKYKTFNSEQANTKEKLESILKYYEVKPSYKPKKFDRTLENVNESLESDEFRKRLKNGEYNCILMHINDEDKNDLSEIVKKLDMDYRDLITSVDGNNNYIFFIGNASFDQFSIYTFRSTDTIIDYIKSNNLEYDKISPIMNFKELKSYINKYIIPSAKDMYKPKKFDRTLENVNESFEDTKNSNYFNKNNALIITFNKNTSLEDFNKFKETINAAVDKYLIRYDLYHNAFERCEEEDGYIAIELKDGEFSRGFCYLSYLPTHVEDNNFKYPKTYDIKYVNTKFKLDNILKYETNIPFAKDMYKPKKFDRTNL